MNVNEPDLSSSLGDRFCRGDECVRNSDENISLIDTGRHECKSQCVGSAIHTDTVFRATEGRKLTLKVLNHRPANKPSGPESFLDHSQELLFELLMRRHKIKKRYSHRIGHATFSPRSQISGTLRDFQPQLRLQAHPWSPRCPPLQSRFRQPLYCSGLWIRNRSTPLCKSLSFQPSSRLPSAGRHQERLPADRCH